MEYESKLTDIIASLPEVSGGFLYSPDKGGIYSNQSGSSASNEALQKVSLKLSKIVSMYAIHFNDTGGVRVSFNNLDLCGIKIDEANWMFLVHQPSLTPGMLKMTVQMALNLEADTNAPVQQQQQASQPAASASTAGGCTMAELLDPDSEMRSPLTIIQEELATHIGPVAELVFDDHVETWCTQSTPSISTLPELVTMLGEEIDDESDRNAFKKNLKGLGS
jgi:hypothetical protein